MKKLHLMILAFCFALPLFAVTSEDYDALKEQARKQNDEYNYLLYKYKELYVPIKAEEERLEKARIAEQERLKRNIIIPSDSTVITEGAFKNNSLLQTVTISEGVTKIGKDAFSGCRSLKSITIPSSVTEIGWDAFSGCSSLTSVTIPSGVLEINVEMKKSILVQS